MNKTCFGVIILIIIAILPGYSIFYGSNYHQMDNSSLNSLKTKHPQVLGSTNYGKVIKSGPYGNSNGTQKIAFIVGVHPLESYSHRAIVTSLLSLNRSLNSSYYVYSIDVTKDRTSYNNGRMNGQLLA